MTAPLFDPETGEVLVADEDRPPSPEAMSLDDARALLVREHGVAIGSDDPLLMLITLHQGMLRDYERMLARHDAGIGRLLGATGEACAGAVETVLASLKDKTVQASLDHAFSLIERQALALDRLERVLRRHRLVHLAFTLLTVGASALVLAVLFTLVR